MAQERNRRRSGCCESVLYRMGETSIGGGTGTETGRPGREAARRTGGREGGYLAGLIFVGVVVGFGIWLAVVVKLRG